MKVKHITKPRSTIYVKFIAYAYVYTYVHINICTYAQYYFSTIRKRTFLCSSEIYPMQRLFGVGKRTEIIELNNPGMMESWCKNIQTEYTMGCSLSLRKEK